MYKVSPSAKGVAFLRHIEVEVSKDTLAGHFCDKEGEEMANKWLGLCPYVGRTVAVRGRYIEDEAGMYIKERGIEQMMNIAAGLNTFPYRHEAASHLKSYAELDLPLMIDFKRTVINDLKDIKVIPKSPVKVDYIPIDLLSDNFHKEFKGLNWDYSLPGIYVFEGMSYYLPPPVLARILNTFSDVIAKGSVLIWDYFPDYVKKGLDPLMATIMSAGGEVCLTYLSADAASGMLKGFKVVSDRLESDLEKVYYKDHIAKPVGSIIVAERC